MSYFLLLLFQAHLSFYLILHFAFSSFRFQFLNGKGSFPKNDFAPTPTIISPENKIVQEQKEDLFSSQPEKQNETFEEKFILSNLCPSVAP